MSNRPKTETFSISHNTYPEHNDITLKIPIKKIAVVSGIRFFTDSGKIIRKFRYIGFMQYHIKLRIFWNIPETDGGKDRQFEIFSLLLLQIRFFLHNFVKL